MTRYPITEEELALIQTHLDGSWVPAVWKGDLNRLVGEVRRLRRLARAALLELQYPDPESLERRDLIAELKREVSE